MSSTQTILTSHGGARGNSARGPGPEPYEGSNTSTVHLVPLDDLTVGYSPRHTKLDPDHVVALIDVVDRLPPVVVDERTMTVLDGVHRLEVFRRLGRSHISAVLFTGNEMEALVIAIQANTTHGKPLTRSERQAAARVLLGRCPERSDRWVGEVCGLSHTTVALLRRSVGSAVAPVRTGRDGRRRPVDPSRGQAAVARVMAENPLASVRQAAGAAGVAPSTVQRMAARLAKSEGSPPDKVALTLRSTVLGAGRRPIGDLALPVPAELADVFSWLSRTAVAFEDLHTYLARLPLSRVYEVADECRRRSRIWVEIADLLEARVRRGTPGI